MAFFFFSLENHGEIRLDKYIKRLEIRGLKFRFRLYIINDNFEHFIAFSLFSFSLRDAKIYYISRFNRKRVREKSVRRKNGSANSGEARKESPFITGYKCHSLILSARQRLYPRPCQLVRSNWVSRIFFRLCRKVWYANYIYRCRLRTRVELCQA